jgi:hypothetical protein
LSPLGIPAASAGCSVGGSGQNCLPEEAGLDGYDQLGDIKHVFTNSLPLSRRSRTATLFADGSFRIWAMKKRFYG